MIRRILLIWWLLSVTTALVAQSVRVSAPQQVAVGEQFQIEYVVNSQDVRSFHPGAIPDGIEILYGPSTSTQSSFQMVNGHTSSSSSTTITYIARATKRGAFTMPQAHVNVGGKNVSAASYKIQAQGSAHVAQRSNPSSADSYDYGRSNAAQAPHGEDLFIRVSANKHHVREQEPILLSYKVYTLVELTHLDGKVPDLKGFHTQEIKLPTQKTFQREQVNGRTYNTVTWSQYVMYPQMTGKLEIPPITFHSVVLRQSRDPFAFITGGGYEEVKRDIKAPGVTITVDPLPTRPKDFSGGVGRFNISAQLTKNEQKTGTPMNLRLVVSGTGNLKLIKKPATSFPKEFEVYDPKVTDKTKLTANGIEGNMVYDYVIVPQKAGKFVIPPFSFTYFDVEAGQYKTLRTQSFDVEIQQGDGETSTTAFSEPVAEDIRPLKTEKTLLSGSDDFFCSPLYWTIIILLSVLLAAILIMFRKTAADHADVARLRGKNANKVATRRLRVASLLKSEGRSSDFYDEILKALWGYVGDKLSMPVEELSRENISERLGALSIDQETIDLFLRALDECEFERYAPGDTKGNMDKTYSAAAEAIMRIEQSMKRKTSKQSDKFMLLLALFFMSSVSVSAVTKNNADTEYKKGNYQQAIRDYEEILKTTESADLYYNLGNAYYRADNIAKAILSYERALQLSPSDEDIRINLRMAQAKTIDKIVPQSEMFLITWMKSLVSLLNIDGWAYLAIIAMIMLVGLAVLWLLADSMRWRIVGFYGATFCTIVFVAANIFAFVQRSWLRNDDGAIVIASSVTVKQTPATTAKDAFVLHEGTRVDILDRSMNGWFEVKLVDGRKGWLQVNKVEEITVND